MKKNYTILKIIIGILAIVAIFVLGLLVGKINKNKQARPAAVIETTALPQVTTSPTVSTTASDIATAITP